MANKNAYPTLLIPMLHLHLTIEVMTKTSNTYIGYHLNVDSSYILTAIFTKINVFNKN